MRIGMMVDSYKPYISGVTNQVELLKTQMEKIGHQVFVFTFAEPQHTSDFQNRIIRSPGIPIADTGFYLSWRYSRKAKHLLQSMDIVHVHHPFLSGRLALRYCRSIQIPIVFTYHSRYDLMAQSYLPLMPEEFSTGVLQTYLPTFCESVQLVTTPTPGMVKVLNDLKVETPIYVLPNGIEIKKFQTAKPLSRASLNFKEDDILLVYVGRIANEKNIPFLLEAFAGLAQAIHNVHLLIIGSGIQEYEDEITSLVQNLQIQNRVHFTGKVAYEDLPAYLAMCDIFVTASIAETFGMSNVEAMGAGLPVMGIQSVGVGDTVADGVTGLLSTHELPAFTAKLTRLCLDVKLRQQLSINARQASYKYDIEKVTEELVAQYYILHQSFQPHKSKWQNVLRRIAEKIVP